jgi:hypothetical protein
MEDALKQMKATNGGSLSTYWQSRCYDIFKDCQKPLTMKENGQLKQLGKYLLDDTKKTIDWALTNWWKFTHEAAAQAGLATVPSAPNVPGGIGFLLKYHGVAVNLMQLAAKQKSPIDEGSPASIPIKQPQIIEEKPATFEEIEKIMAELDEGES